MPAKPKLSTSHLVFFHGSWNWKNPNTDYYGNTAPLKGVVAATWDSVTNSTLKSGSNRPNWREMIRLGREAGTNYSVSGTKWSQKPIYAVIQGKIIKVSDNTSIPGSITFFGSRDAGSSGTNWNAITNAVLDWSDLRAQGVEREARMQFYQKRLAIQRRFQTGVTLGEFGQTVRMFRKPLSGMSSLINSHVQRAARAAHGKRGKKVTERSWTRAVNDSWLEAQYGLMPLVGEIEDLSGLVSDPFRWPVEDLYSKAEDIVNGSAPAQNGNLFGTSFSPNVRWTGDLEEKITVKYMGALRYRPSVVENKVMKWGLGPKDFLPTVWNLIPYSFLLDYFTSVGGVIDGVSHGALNLDWGCRVEKRSSSASWRMSTRPRTYTYDGVGPVLTYRVEAPFSSDGHVFTKERYSYTRSVIDKVSVGFSDLYFRLPRGDTAWKKWTNVGALALARVLPPVLRQKLIPTKGKLAGNYYQRGY